MTNEVHMNDQKRNSILQYVICFFLGLRQKNPGDLEQYKVKVLLFHQGLVLAHNVLSTA